MFLFFEGEAAGGFSFSSLTIIDYIIAGIVLIGMLIGAKKGFMNQLFGIIGSFGAILGAVLLCKTVGGLMSPNSGFLFDKISAFLSKSFSGEEATLMYTTPVNYSDPNNATAAMALIGIPGFLASFLTSIFAGLSPNGTPVALSEVLPVQLTTYANYAVAFVLLFIAFAIVIAILKKLLLKAVKLPILKTVDKLLGFILGAAFALIIIVGVLFLLTFLGSFVSALGGIVDKVYEGSFFGVYLQKLVDIIMGFMIKQ